jgi:peptide/nickel transport system substrate-binding protein
VRNTKRVFTAVVAAGIGVALVTACSSSSGGKSSGTTGAGNGGSKSATGGVAPPPSSGAPTGSDPMDTTARAGVKQGGTLNWGISQTISNFNYNEVDGTEVDAFNMDNSLLPQPFHYTAAGAPSVDTDYFTSITQTSTSPQTIDYKINPKAKWSDGTAISWEDIQAQAAALTGKNAAYKVSGTTGYDQIASVKMGANAQEAIVTYAKDFGDWQSLFSPLFPKSLNATAAAFNTGWVNQPLITAGPFKWGSQDKTASSYTVVRDPAWWGDPAKLDSITYKAYDDPAAAVQALGSHQLDYYDISGGTAYQNIQAIKKYSGVDSRIAGGSNFRQFTLNTKDAVLSDIKVRQAVVLGLDRNRITQLLIGNLGGNPTSLDNHIFLKNQGAYKSTCANLCNYDPAAAKTLLEGDGYTMSGGYFTKGGKTLSLAITVPASTPNATQESETAQATLKTVGIKLTITPVPSNDFFSKYIIPGKFQLTTFTWIGQPFPVSSSVPVYNYDPKNVGENYGFGGTAAINALLAQSLSAPNPTSEDNLANQADALIWQNAAWIPLYQRPQVFGVTSTLVNLGAPGFEDYRWADIGFKA